LKCIKKLILGKVYLSILMRPALPKTNPLNLIRQIPPGN
jgi:hypothetical protein